MKARSPLRLGPWLSMAVSAAVAVGLACGADQALAPACEVKNPDLAQCKDFAQLMPNFLAAIDHGETRNLKTVVETQLLVGRTADDPPPINDVLRAVFATLTRFARAPPEAGAVPPALCAPDGTPPPPPAQANQLCELRRGLFVLVHQGKGISAINLIDPLITALVNYIIGQSNRRTLADGGVVGATVPVMPHYEIATVISSICAQDNQCQLVNTLDLAIALSAYLETAEGTKTVADLQALLAKPSIQALLDTASGSGLTEDGMVAIANVLVPALQNADPVALQSIVDISFLSPYQADLQPVIDDLKLILDPAHQPNLKTPLNRALTCLTAKDKKYELVRMAHRLAVQDRLPEFSVSALTGAANSIRDLDPRGALIHLVGAVAQTVRSDETAIDAAANVCQKLFSTKLEAGQTQSNAELTLPVVADLFSKGVATEAVCAIDTLVWGCSGGATPACPNGNTRPAGTAAICVGSAP